MLEMEVTRTAEVIAREINEIKGKARETLVSASIEIGKRLVEAKAMVPAGRWGEWLKTNVEYSERTAQNLMRVYDEYGKNGIPEGLLRVSYTNAVALLGLPEDIRVELLESGAAEHMSARELEAEVKRLKDELEDQQVTFDGLVADLNKAEEAQEKLEGENRLLKENETILRNATMEYRKTMKEAQDKAIQAAKELTEAKNALKAQQAPLEPAVVVEEKVPDEVLKELAELRSRAKEAGKGESEILFYDTCARLMEDFKRCAELIQETERWNPERAGTLKKYLDGTAGNLLRGMGMPGR